MDPSHQTAGGGGRFRADPDPALGPFVVEYWALARDLAAMGGFTITPDCFGELICCADVLHAVGAEGGRARLPTCFVVGLLDEPLRVEAAGVVRCMAARLRPWAIGRFLVDDGEAARRGWGEAGAVFGAGLAEVVDRVGRRDWPGLVGIFDRALIETVGRWGPVEAGPEEVGPFLGDDRRPTSAVAVERDTSGRQLERRVRRLTGSSPKRLACLARFQAARDAIWLDPAVDLARLATRAGYSDQPHMTRDFRRHAGMTPARFARESAAKKLWLAAEDVAIVQEPPPVGA